MNNFVLWFFFLILIIAVFILFVGLFFLFRESDFKSIILLDKSVSFKILYLS